MQVATCTTVTCKRQLLACDIHLKNPAHLITLILAHIFDFVFFLSASSDLLIAHDKALLM